MKSKVAWLRAACLVLAAAVWTPLSARGGCFEIVENEQGVLIREDGRNVLFYQRRPKSLEGRFARANYIHPLWGLDGEVLTEDFPADHRHHRGIFWAWHQVWVGKQRIGDPWVIKDFQWDVQHLRLLPPRCDSVALQLDVLWKSPRWRDKAGRLKPLVRETSVVRIYAASQQRRQLDFQIQLQALEPNMRLGGSDDEKGYGGFSVRLRLPPGVVFRGAAGPVEPKRLSVDPSPWMDITGPYGPGGSLAGVTILCHPSLPGYPQRWILRQRRSMQNPVFPGREAVPLPADQPLALRYRLVLHNGAVEGAEIEKWHAQYSATVAEETLP